MKHFFLIIAVFLFPSLIIAQEFPEPMVPKRMVNDFSGLFDAKELNGLEGKLRSFNDTSSTQIAVVTVNTLYGYDANDYAQRLGQKWGIGQKGKDNGVLILIKPKSDRERGEVAIAVGYGLEGVIPDVIAARIIRNEVIPAFQKGQFYHGVNNAVEIIMKLSAGEYSAADIKKPAYSGYILIGLFVLFGLLSGLSKRNKGFTTDHNGSAPSIPPFIFLGGAPHRRGGFGSSGGGFGGFGGFGGGGFGGGGARGSW